MVEIQGIEYLTPQEAARILDVAPESVRRWCDYRSIAGVIDRGPHQRPRYFIPAESLEGFEPPSASGGGWPAGRKRK